MKTLRESILSQVGGGDRYFDEQLKKWGLDPRKTTWNKDGSIDYNGDVNFNSKDFTKIPFKFNKVKCSFYCSKCKNLLSLEGAPQEVGGHFSCNDCKKLTTLEGCPKEVGDGFYCYNCTDLTLLKGSPKKVGGCFSCGGCEKLESLKGGPEEVRGYYNCSCCKKITFLKGCPKEVGDDFYCSDCGKEFTEEEVRKYCKVKKYIYV